MATTAAPGLPVIPPSIGGFQLVGTPTTEPNSAPTGFDASYQRPPAVLVLAISRWPTAIEATDSLTKLVAADKSFYGVAGSVFTASGNGNTYFCVTGTDPTSPRGLQTACRWRVHAAVYALTLNPDILHADHPAADVGTMTTLASEAQAASSV